MANPDAKTRKRTDRELGKIAKLQFKPWKSRAGLDELLTVEEFDIFRRVAILASYVMLKSEAEIGALATSNMALFKTSVARFDDAGKMLDLLALVIKSASARLFVGAAKTAYPPHKRRRAA